MANRGAYTDWISHLPIEIIEKILNLLPCRDAVRTCILSSDWRYKWTSMSDLNFGSQWSTADKHAKFITQCLLRHQGPIRKFGVQSNTMTVGRKIEQWMQLVSKHDIEELQLVLGNIDYPRCSLACLFNCKKLTHLKLQLSNYMLEVPTTFEGFLNLKLLKLSIRMMDGSSVERLISKSPLLENLNLYVYNDSNIAITISAPRIKYLSLKGHFKGICLEKSPLLVDMRLRLFGDQRCYETFKILSGAPNLVKLAWDYFERYVIGCNHGVLSTTFSYLKEMTLLEFELGESQGIPLVLELLTSAPNLEKLVIYNRGIHRYLPKKVDSNFWKKEYLAGHCFMKLKVVEIGYILCMAPETEFAKFILSNSPILEKMAIGTRERKQAIITRMLKKLHTLPHASAQVAVTFHDGDSGWSPNSYLEI